MAELSRLSNWEAALAGFPYPSADYYRAISKPLVPSPRTGEDGSRGSGADNTARKAEEQVKPRKAFLPKQSQPSSGRSGSGGETSEQESSQREDWQRFANPGDQGSSSYNAVKILEEALPSVNPSSEMVKEILASSYTPSDTDSQFLRSMGIQIPDTAEKEERGTPMQFSNVKDAASYSYSLTPEEVRAITAAIGDKSLISTEATNTDATRYGMLQKPVYSGYANNGSPSVEFKASIADLNPSEYGKLTADQKYAVDFNTRLVEARNKDIGSIAELDPEDAAAYNSKVEKIFGKGGGSEKYAPNVVDFLAEIDFKAVGQDLDEYLSLERSIKADELATFKMPENGMKLLEYDRTALSGDYDAGALKDAAGDYASARSSQNLSAVELESVLRNKAQIESVMRNASRVLWDWRSSIAGADAYSQAETPYGFSTATARGEEDSPQILTMDEWTKASIDRLRDPKVKDPLKDIENEMALGEFTDEERNDFIALVDRMTRDEVLYGYPGGSPRRTPQEIRTILGWKD